MDVMQAAVLESLGNWNYRKMPMPECGDHEVVIQTKRSGICSTDVVRSMKTGFYRYPIIPGHEFCGVVVHKGKNVSTFDIDDHVAVYPLMPCKKCKPCTKGKQNLCDSYNFLGSRTHGGYAEYVLCPEENLIRIQKGISSEQAAMTEPASVALHGIKVAELDAQCETAVIMGLGPIGLMTVQWAKIFGIKTVIGVDRNEHRFRIAKEIGTNHVIDTRDSEASVTINDLTNKDGADIIFECSGSDELQTQSILSAAKGGKIVILGNPAKNLAIDKDAYSRILRREITITGSWSSMIGQKNEWEESLRAMKEGKIDPIPVITHGFHLSEAKQVMEDMHFKKFEFSKVHFYF